MDNFEKIKNFEKKINQLKEKKLDKKEDVDNSKIELIKLKEEIENEINNIKDLKQDIFKNKLIELKKEIEDVEIKDWRDLAYEHMLKEIDEAIIFYKKMPFLWKYIVWILNKAKNE